MNLSTLAQNVAVLTCIHEVLGSNLGSFTDCSAGDFHGFPQSLEVNASMMV
jgi:hypothetical protein